MASADTEAASRPVVIRIAGALQVECGGQLVDSTALGSRKARTLLRLLAAQRTELVTSDRAFNALWPAGLDRPSDPQAILAGLVSRLRKILGTGVIDGGRAGYRLAGPPMVVTDFDQAREFIAQAEREAVAEPALAATSAAAAAALLGNGPGVPEEPDSPWVLQLRAEVTMLRRRARHLFAAAATEIGDMTAARDAAEQAAIDDPFDEIAVRLLMSVAIATGNPAAALRAFAALRHGLAEELGTDPAPATQELYLAVLHGETAPQSTGLRIPRRASPRPANGEQLALTDRDSELAMLRGAWADAVQGSGRRVLIVGEPGIGKTRLTNELAGLAAETGGLVLSARCYEAEQSLFAQPFVDAVTDLAAQLPARELHAAAGPDVLVLARLVPVLSADSDSTNDDEDRARRPDTELQRTFEAICGFFDRLSQVRPVLLAVDDLQHAGRTTLALLHYLGRRLATRPVLVAVALRTEEGEAALTTLGPGASIVTLGRLSEAAVVRLAESAGQGAHGHEIARHTGGHPLFVAETLRAMSTGDTGIPPSLQKAVLERVSRSGGDTERLLRAGAVLGATFSPAVAAALLQWPLPVALECCEKANRARLLTVLDAEYEFAHDVVREVLLDTTPMPTRVAYHRLAADLLVQRPEAVAGHAEAIGDLIRAARAWLVAAEQALMRFAFGDATALADRALATAATLDNAEIVGRALITRGRALDASGAFGRAIGDFEQARVAAVEAGDRRLEMAALRQLGGDVTVALGRPPADCEVPLRRALDLSGQLGDRGAEADSLNRLAILACNRLDFIAASQLAQRALLAGRMSGDDRALIQGLDAGKTVHAYLGDLTHLGDILGELDPLLRRHGDLWTLQWARFEGAFVPLAREDYPRAIEALEQSVEICRRSGSFTNEPFFLAHVGWAHRLAGDLDTAITQGQRAVVASDAHRHAWWATTAAAMLGASLLEAGRPDDAARLVEPAARAAAVPGAQAYLLRCLAVLAEATGSSRVRARADALLDGITAPPGLAWLLGADAYLCLSRAAAAAGDHRRAAEIRDRLGVAARRCGWNGLAALVETAVPGFG